jgi:hypothetical protein
LQRLRSDWQGHDRHVVLEIIFLGVPFCDNRKYLLAKKTEGWELKLHLAGLQANDRTRLSA